VSVGSKREKCIEVDGEGRVEYKGWLSEVTRCDDWSKAGLRLKGWMKHQQTMTPFFAQHRY
jgi:hypothetical protein